MDDFPGPYGGLGQDYSGPNHDAGRDTCSSGTCRFFVVAFGTMLAVLLLAAALRSWVFHW